MGTAADDLRDREEQLLEEHLLEQCIPEDCPYCIEIQRQKVEWEYEQGFDAPEYQNSEVSQ